MTACRHHHHHDRPPPCSGAFGSVVEACLSSPSPRFLFPRVTTRTQQRGLPFAMCLAWKAKTQGARVGYQVWYKSVFFAATTRGKEDFLEPSAASMSLVPNGTVKACVAPTRAKVHRFMFCFADAALSMYMAHLYKSSSLFLPTLNDFILCAL